MKEYIIKIDEDKKDIMGNCPLVEKPYELVRCKDCKWAEVSDNEHTWCDHVDHEFCHNNDWFCADGERRDANSCDKCY